MEQSQNLQFLAWLTPILILIVGYFMQQKFEDIKENFARMERRFDKVETRLDQIEGRKSASVEPLNSPI